MLSPVLAGAGAATVVVAAGDATGEAWFLATIAGIIFGDLARRARGERREAGGDVTDLAFSLAFLAVLIAAAFDVGRSGSGPSSTRLDDAFGVAVIALALLLRRCALRALGANYAVRLGVSADQRLIDHGPYRWIRHPNYSALLAIALGTAVALSSPSAAVVTLAVWLPIVMLRIEREERMLVAHFGERYERYRRRSWRLVPGVY